MAGLPTDQKKVLGFTDIVIMTITANFGLRWISVAAGMGAQAFIFWFLAALLFFVPLALITAQLSKKYPEEGGVYAWTLRALGERSAFMVSWLYWINGVFYYPAVLIFLATNFAYALGHPEWAADHTFITVCVLIAFWIIVVISYFGLRASRFVVRYGGTLGTVIPIVAVIVMAVIAAILSGHSATSYAPAEFIPDHHIFGTLSTLSIMMFAMAGVEVIPTFSNSVKNPKRDLYFGLIVGAVLIVLFYNLGTLAINLVVDKSSVSSTAGLMQAFTIIDAKLHMGWMTRFMAFLITFSDLAAVTVWLIAPVVMFFKCTPRGIIPDWFHKTNKYEAPSNALWFMGVLVSIIILITNFVPNVKDMYQVLVLMASILYFLPYFYLSISYAKLKMQEGGSKFWAYLLATLVIVCVAMGILFSFPPPDTLTTTHDIFLYEAELVLGPLFFVAIGWWLYQRGRRRKL